MIAHIVSHSLTKVGCILMASHHAQVPQCHRSMSLPCSPVLSVVTILLLSLCSIVGPDLNPDPAMRRNQSQPDVDAAARLAPVVVDKGYPTHFTCWVICGAQRVCADVEARFRL